MSHKSKLVLKTISTDLFELVKSVNTLDYGVPGDTLSRSVINRLFIENQPKIKRGDLTIEFINGRSK